MQKKLVAVGMTLPGELVEQVSITSDRSLLDADLVLVKPGIPYDYYSYFQGKPWLEDTSAFRARESIAHWRREIDAAFYAGKVIIIFLCKPYEVFVDTGGQSVSGTGRNARVTKNVEPLSSYDLVPLKLTAFAASGTGIRPAKDLKDLALYWKEFGACSPYEVYLQCDVSEQLLCTKDGNRLVGAAVRKGTGAILLLPPIDLELAGCIEGSGKRARWSEKAVEFEKRLVATLVATANAIQAGSAITPTPEWATSSQYRLADETGIEQQISQAARELETVQRKKFDLETRLKEAIGPRRLLFESGKQLEFAILDALRFLGFKAEPFADADLEFDAVFVSAEGRFIGEAEGKDNRAINIDKITQLERNLQEDFQRDGVEEYAKGVLFGNVYRLQAPESRGDYFTEKCLKAAVRLGVALVRTPDLFAPVKYLGQTKDEEYARVCRRAILSTSGAIVEFPRPPIDEEPASVAASAGDESDAAQLAVAAEEAAAEKPV